ncbi:hypothetical protein V3331_18105 [Gaopeijia maritima]|uniref:hypothetical protein n=1 Tax=Gaopeijia maritima TaxID=3119007 RepID=UPI00325411DA
MSIVRPMLFALTGYVRSGLVTAVSAGAAEVTGTDRGRYRIGPVKISISVGDSTAP